ncbi:hypothetical protein SLA2020_030540 [Shorea laevis]
MTSIKLSLLLVTFVIINSSIPFSLGMNNTLVYERCLRLVIWPQSPLPSSPDGRFYSISSVDICHDLFRYAIFSLRINGRLPSDYLKAVCNVFKDDERKVNEHLRRNYPTYDLKKMRRGHFCVYYHIHN